MEDGREGGRERKGGSNGKEINCTATRVHVCGLDLMAYLIMQTVLHNNLTEVSYLQPQPSHSPASPVQSELNRLTHLISLHQHNPIIVTSS